MRNKAFPEPLFNTRVCRIKPLPLLANPISEEAWLGPSALSPHLSNAWERGAEQHVSLRRTNRWIWMSGNQSQLIQLKAYIYIVRRSNLNKRLLDFKSSDKAVHFYSSGFHSFLSKIWTVHKIHLNRLVGLFAFLDVLIRTFDLFWPGHAQLVVNWLINCAANSLARVFSWCFNSQERWEAIKCLHNLKDC